MVSRFEGKVAAITGGIAFFVAGLAFWVTFIGPEPNAAFVVLGMVPTGIGVGLTFPTLMGVSASSPPPSSFATGSGVINMIRQAAIAVGVAIFVAVVASPASLAARVSAFHRGWWIMAVITALGLISRLFLFGQSERRKAS